MRIEGTNVDFIVVGENIHTTRVISRKGKRIIGAEGAEAIAFVGVDGKDYALAIDDAERKSQNWDEGRVKHMKVAVRAAMHASGTLREAGEQYIALQIQRQIDSGADFLDLNVDEISVRDREQQDAMVWLVKFVQERSSVPLSVDSSNSETIRIGLEASDKRAGATMLNSASLERLSALELAVEHDAPVIVTAAGESGMPQDAEARFAHVTRIVEAASARDIPLDRIHVDPLMFPISVDSRFGGHALGAIGQIRERYGSEIHITGGFSNVSFGLPARRLINDVFFILAIEAGADGGIINPVASNPQNVFSMDRASNTYKLAETMLLGGDRDCRQFLRAFRKGELAGW
jgi:5-methyltetrahydrofolate--homocysteine methyltransferase